MKYYYVRIDRMNGVKDFMNLAEWTNTSGIGDVDYNQGGWADMEPHTVSPHLRFDREGDAIAYVLAHGGFYTTTVPTNTAEA